MLKVRGECSNVVRSFRVKRSASLQSLHFQFFSYLSVYYFPISNFVRALWSSVAVCSSYNMSLQLQRLFETASNSWACCLQYSLAAVGCSWRQRLLGPDLAVLLNCGQNNMLCRRRHCFWVTLLLFCTKCLPSVHIAPSVYNCQDLRSIIIKNTYVASHVCMHSEFFWWWCCPLKTTQKLAGGRGSMWEMQYLQKRKGENKALLMGVRHFHTFVVDPVLCLIVWSQWICSKW